MVQPSIDYVRSCSKCHIFRHTFISIVSVSQMSSFKFKVINLSFVACARRQTSTAACSPQRRPWRNCSTPAAWALRSPRSRSRAVARTQAIPAAPRPTAPSWAHPGASHASRTYWSSNHSPTTTFSTFTVSEVRGGSSLVLDPCY